MENQTSDLKKAIQELLKGRELGNQLFELVHHRGSKSNNGDEAGSLLIRPFAEDLVKNILRSFTNALLLLSTDCDSDEVSLRDSSSDLAQSCKNFSIRNRRGCYKRKRNTQTWEKDSPILVDDGYAWRKYGQKMTMNAKYLRNYYRCSHKYDEGCPAIKQVQRIQENPPLYRTTYYGLHTCKNLEMALDPSSPTDSSILLSFNNTNIPNKDHPFLSSSTKKQHEENQIIHMEMEQNQLYEVSLDSSRHVTVLSSTLDEDVISSVKIESFGVDDVLLRCFDFDDFVRFGL